MWKNVFQGESVNRSQSEADDMDRKLRVKCAEKYTLNCYSMLHAWWVKDGLPADIPDILQQFEFIQVVKFETWTKKIALSPRPIGLMCMYIIYSHLYLDKDWGVLWI